MKRFDGLNGHGLRVWGLTGLIAMGVFLLTRIVLLVHAVIFSQQTLDVLLVPLALGVLRDIPAAAVVASPWLVFELLFSAKWRDRLRRPLFAVYLFTLLFVAVSEGIFWDEFSVRFNFIALDYLVFTTEVIGNIKESYPVGKIVAALAVLTAVVFWGLRRPLRQALAVDVKRRSQLGWALGLLVVAWVSAYKMAPPEFAANTYANELADNGWRSFLWAARQNKLNYRQFYATRPDGEVMTDLQRLSGHGLVTATQQPVQKVAYKPAKQPNVVVVMMESMSAEYMATFGNDEGLTPNLDRLAKEGLLFTRLYAAGTRTVRGLEALSAGLPPLPGKSVVRWPNITNLNTLGGALAARGWSPHFLYGGYGMFDNMNGYFAAQGYKVTDRTGFKDGLIEFENVWGVADEHLFDQVLGEIDADAAAGRPFFGHIMTASNHVPFTYPEGRIDIPSPGKRRGGVKYADYAVGRFIEMAKQKPWFDNTIFVFVADHCASSAGKAKIPVHRYHIPAIVYAPKLIAPKRVDTLASQIDLVPTMLAMLGLQGDDHFVGRDILRMPPEEGRALLSTYQNLGYLKGDVMTVLEPRRKIETFKISADGKDAQPMPTNPQLAEEAIAYFQGAALLMDRHGEHGEAAAPSRGGL
ncbi:LTA synthase family protein [Dechloromonas denitrificans]|uniref:LTA synthase family protein n=1 Tax=Dechloromonas denitrificans TaxID=281362 RepID=UPI001CF9421E|nr:LTA synthase family protein [Dechloromonas denitrificans]UCV08611.1 sulfatase-like hydrolase/transferase [Dechloromonas denitrificans]